MRCQTRRLPQRGLWNALPEIQHKMASILNPGVQEPESIVMRSFWHNFRCRANPSSTTQHHENQDDQEDHDNSSKSDIHTNCLSGPEPTAGLNCTIDAIVGERLSWQAHRGRSIPPRYDALADAFQLDLPLVGFCHSLLMRTSTIHRLQSTPAIDNPPGDRHRWGGRHVTGAVSSKKSADACGSSRVSSAVAMRSCE